MDYHFRFYYLVRDSVVIRKIKDKFRITVSVNGESNVRVNTEGAELVRELERRGFIKIREYKEL
jgi:hypothetical protein